MFKLQNHQDYEFRLRMRAYCGMTYTIAQGDQAHVRSVASRRLRRARRDTCVSVLEVGKKWELETPEDAWMVSDEDGILEIQYRRAR